MGIPGRVTVVALLVLLATSAAASPALASQGSVPAEVTAYASDPDGLVARLDELAGVSADGTGIEFDETTTSGQLNRVFTFTSAWAAGEDTDTPVERQNLWTTPISVRDEVLGLAIIWINPETVRPELADFVPDIDLATELTDVAAESYLVYDEARAAWFILDPPALATVKAGTSGLTGATTLGAYQDFVVTDDVDAAAPVDAFNLGSVLSVATIAVSALAVVVVVLVSVFRRRRPRPGDDEVAPTP